MKKFDKVCLWVLFGIVAVFVVANVYVLQKKSRGSGRPYRVEISRLARQMEELADELSGGAVRPETLLKNGIYVTAIVPDTGEDASFFETNSDYLIREIGGIRYRFEYMIDAGTDQGSVLWTVNVSLGIMTLLLVSVLLYMRQKVLRPFHRMEGVPYELSKGNLTVPLTENKNRFFGRFVWGVNLLRENIEQQKERELELQKEKKTLLLSLSHDIKTPLSAIKLYAKALTKGLYTEKEKQAEIAENINAKADEIEGFVSEIIRASSDDFLSFELRMGEFYLSELLNEIGTYYGEKLNLIKTEFEMEDYPNCLLKGDKDRAVEVIQNLMENAIKYGNGEKISIAVSEEDDCNLISVINGGCTLSENELPHIFESFWRGSNAENKRGSGLGLYICRQLMRKMGGEVFAKLQNHEMIVTAVFPKA